MKLIEKIFIQGIIILKTGLHVGGAKTAMDIGGLDSPVIKTPNGVPYIPGSSLKGKLRSLLAKDKNGAQREHEDDPMIKKIFGYAGNNKQGQEKDPEITRLIVRDAYLDQKLFEIKFPAKEVVLETSFTEGKYENTIDRKSGKAGGAGPRQIERVPAGAVFNFELVLDVYGKAEKTEMLQLLNRGFELLEKDYLGGSGTRGYGQVEIELNENSQKFFVS
jgi:CRISPR-associated protein Csm3